MMRSAVVRIGMAAVLMALPAAAFLGHYGLSAVRAQSGPPDLPLVLYGNTTPQTTVGQKVHAYVYDGTTWTHCGLGAVVADGGQQGYTVQVAHSSQISGCGASGRQIQLYFTPHPEGGQYDGTGGRLTQGTIPWSSEPFEEVNVTLEQPLEVRGVVAGIAARVE